LRDEWSKYRCVVPSPEFGSTSELREIYHVTHAATALRIVEDGLISRGLVHDESKLNITRRTVVWASPNTWHQGSRYGTVQFKFDWSSLVAGKSMYWVEAMTGYKPHAVRIFITDGDIAGLPPLTPYDPASANGPLRLYDGRWWRNGDYTLEIMVDSDLPLTDCTGVDFVRHHPTYCNIGSAQCSERGKDGHQSGARVMAYVLTMRRKVLDDALVVEGRFTSSAEAALVMIGQSLGAMSGAFAGPIGRQESAVAIVKGALAQLAMGRQAEGKKLVATLKSDKHFWRALQSVCVKHFGISSSLLEGATGV
jgi:hypothetical protein